MDTTHTHHTKTRTKKIGLLFDRQFPPSVFDKLSKEMKGNECYLFYGLKHYVDGETFEIDANGPLLAMRSTDTLASDNASVNEQLSKLIMVKGWDIAARTLNPR